MRSHLLFIIIFEFGNSFHYHPADTSPDLNKNWYVTVQCIHKISAMLGKQKMTLWYSPEQVDMLSELLKKVKVPIVLNAAERPLQSGMETRTMSDVVLILNGLNIERVLNETLWNGETRFFKVAHSLKQIEKDFGSFWKFKVVNVFEILTTDLEVVVHSFFPFEKGKCGIPQVVVVDVYRVDSGSFSNDGEAFKEPVRIKNMNGCYVNVTVVNVKPNVMFEDECGCNASMNVKGIEGNLMQEVAKKLNFKATFVIALDGIGWGWIRPSPHGAVGEVFTGRSDFAIGLLAPTLERHESLDLSLPYDGEECITYGVPTGAGASTPNWITILVFEFSPLTWLLIFFSFAVVVYVFRCVNKFARLKWFPTQTDVILYVFSSCLGLPVKVPNHLPLRLSLTFWMIFTFIVTVAYRSSMGSKLTVPNKDPDINTFAELLKSKLELTGYNNMLRLLQYNESEPNIKKMLDRFKVTDYDIDYAVDRIAAERKMAYVRHTTTFLYYALINPKAKGHIHVIKDCIMLYHPLVVTKKHSPFSSRLNQLISRMMESGITKRWRSEYIYSIPPPSKPFLKLSNDHMYGVFCILCCGHVIGLLVLFGEIIDFRFRKKY